MRTKKAPAMRSVWVRTYLRVAHLFGFRANLHGADLNGAYLCRANLRDADLPGANLSVANLSGANLIRANLSVANLRGADLREANLREATCAKPGTWMRLAVKRQSYPMASP
jgi:uncharacterized protein YjbI with pentapeptide repeats